MDHPSAVSGVFAKPFPEQVAFFRQKMGNLVPTQAWDDLEGQEHDTGFMVAGAATADLLTDLAAATDKAIAQGRGIEDFRKDFRSIVASNGWTGWTGEGSIGGEAWRVGVIYRTNSYTSYAAGRHAQLLDGDFAYWVYFHGASKEPRPQHLSWNGLSLIPSHIFWRTHYPPSDWGCSCYVVGASSARAVARLGGDLSKKLPDNWQSIDLKTGEMVGIGKGWGYAPGASVAETVSTLAGKVRNWDYAIAKAYMSDLPADRADAFAQAYRALPATADDARRFAQAVLDDRPPAAGNVVQTLGLVTSDQAAQITRLAGRDVTGFDFRFTPDAVRHVASAHGDPATEIPRGQIAVTADDYALLPQILSNPDEITGPDTSAIGETLIHFVRSIGGNRYTVTMAINRAYRSLTLKTMFVGVKP